MHDTDDSCGSVSGSLMSPLEHTSVTALFLGVAVVRVVAVAQAHQVYLGNHGRLDPYADFKMRRNIFRWRTS